MRKINRAISPVAAAVVAVVIILIAGFGIYYSTIGVNPIGSINPGGTMITDSQPSNETTTATTTCYSITSPPTNLGISNIFNVTQDFDSWNWTFRSFFTVGSYEFHLVESQNSQSTMFLEPQLFINVTNAQGQTQTTQMTNLGSFNGNSWPPDLSLGPDTLFGGNVMIQWLFPCGNHNVLLAVTTTLPSFSSSSSQSANASSVLTVSCSISGQPGGIQLEILSDLSSSPIVGATVYATNSPDFCNNSPATTQKTISFTTNSTMWYSLPSDNNGGYSFIVSYSGQNYTFSAPLQPVSMTCATLYIPSGHTNVTTTEFGMSC